MKLLFYERLKLGVDGFVVGHDNKGDKTWGYFWYNSPDVRNSVKDEIKKLIKEGVISTPPLMVNSIQWECKHCGHLFANGDDPHINECPKMKKAEEANNKKRMNYPNLNKTGNKNKNEKTKECHNWRDHGKCKFGDSCRFIHGNNENKGKGREPDNKNQSYYPKYEDNTSNNGKNETNEKKVIDEDLNKKLEKPNQNKDNTENEKNDEKLEKNENNDTKEKLPEKTNDVEMEPTSQDTKQNSTAVNIQPKSSENSSISSSSVSSSSTTTSTTKIKTTSSTDRNASRNTEANNKNNIKIKPIPTKPIIQSKTTNENKKKSAEKSIASGILKSNVTHQTINPFPKDKIADDYEDDDKDVDMTSDGEKKPVSKRVRKNNEEDDGTKNSKQRTKKL